MKALYVWAAVLTVLFLIGQIRLGGVVVYGADGLRAWARFGRFRISVFPLKEKEKAPKKKKAAKKTPRQGEKKVQPAKPRREKAGGALDYARSLLPVALEAAKHTFGKLRMDKLELRLTVGASDPADAATRYGQASAVLGTFWYPLTQAFRVVDGYAKVELDFDRTDMALYAESSLSLKLGQLVWLALYFGSKALRAVLAARKRQMMKQQVRKAG